MPKFFITTAIDYSNGEPHLGHALEKIGADCIARYRRLRGDEVHFPMGMDEHSQSGLKAAAPRGAQPRRWAPRHGPAPPRGVPPPPGAHPGAPPRRSVRSGIRGVVLHRL